MVEILLTLLVVAVVAIAITFFDPVILRRRRNIGIGRIDNRTVAGRLMRGNPLEDEIDHAKADHRYQQQQADKIGKKSRDQQQNAAEGA